MERHSPTPLVNSRALRRANFLAASSELVLPGMQHSNDLFHQPMGDVDNSEEDFFEIAQLFDNADLDEHLFSQPTVQGHRNGAVASFAKTEPALSPCPQLHVPIFQSFQPPYNAFNALFTRKRRLDQQPYLVYNNPDTGSCFSPTSSEPSQVTSASGEQFTEGSVHSVQSYSSLSSINSTSSCNTFGLFSSSSSPSPFPQLPSFCLEPKTTVPALKTEGPEPAANARCKKEAAAKDADDSESFTNVEDGDLEPSRSKWSAGDSNKLWRGILACGNEWRAIRKLFPTRSYDQVKDKGRRLLRQRQWKTGRTKFMVDDAAERARLIAQGVLEERQKSIGNKSSFATSAAFKYERSFSKSKKIKAEEN